MTTERAERVAYKHGLVEVRNHDSLSANVKKFSFPVNVGDQLPNGAVILAEAEVTVQPPSEPEKWPYDIRRVSHILCLSKGYHPFCVWTRIVGIGLTASGGFELLDYCIHGDYYTKDRLAEAVLALENR